VDKNVLARTIDIMGASIFLNNQDISPVSSHANLSIDGKFLQNHVKESPAIYNPPYQIYKEPAKQVIDNAELCFQKNKVYHSSDHNTLPIEIQRNFASKMKRNTITIKGRIKEFVPSGVLKIYHAFRNKY
jgi:hypothetical protein